jgi:hypothetical protein
MRFFHTKIRMRSSETTLLHSSRRILGPKGSAEIQNSPLRENTAVIYIEMHNVYVMHIFQLQSAYCNSRRTAFVGCKSALKCLAAVIRWYDAVYVFWTDQAEQQPPFCVGSQRFIILIHALPVVNFKRHTVITSLILRQKYA